MLSPVIKKNDKKANLLIGIVSFVVFATVVILGRVKLEADLGFDVHIFARINAIINTTVSVLLVLGLVAVKQKQYLNHKKIMFTAMILSGLFLVSYICHHLFAGEARYGGDGILRIVYYFILATHIFLAAIIMPFILYSAYRALTGEWHRHRRLARITWPVWFYVAVTGPLVYLMISPYYQ